jgi:hypothetical protein
VSGRILTEVSATVPSDRAGAVLAAYRALLEKPLPDGMIRTQLVEGPDDAWRIQSLWRDQTALDTMRAGPEPPAAPLLFRNLGVEPTLTILQVRDESRGNRFHS